MLNKRTGASNDSCCRTVRGAEIRLHTCFTYIESLIIIKDYRVLILYRRSLLLHIHIFWLSSKQLIYHCWGNNHILSCEHQQCLWAVRWLTISSLLKDARLRGSLVSSDSPHYLLFGALWLLPKANWFTPGRFGAWWQLVKKDG